MALFKVTLSEYPTGSSVKLYPSQAVSLTVAETVPNEYIKLYVPIDGEGLEECVNLIFDFSLSISSTKNSTDFLIFERTCCK